MRLYNVQEIVVAHFTTHPHLGADDIGIIVLIALMLMMVVVGFINDSLLR